MFAADHVILSGGSNTLKHILAPSELLLSLFLLYCIGTSMVERVEDSFNLGQIKEFSRKCPSIYDMDPNIRAG
jgi:hypothetical protein